MKLPRFWRSTVALSFLLLLGVGLKGQDPVFYWNCEPPLPAVLDDDDDAVPPIVGMDPPPTVGLPPCFPVTQVGGVGGSYMEADCRSGVFKEMHPAFAAADFLEMAYGDRDHNDPLRPDDIVEFTVESWHRFENLAPRMLFDWSDRLWFFIDEEKIELRVWYDEPGAGGNFDHTFRVSLDGVEQLDPCYYLDDRWHHFVLRYRYIAGAGVDQFSVFVDGVHLPLDAPFNSTVFIQRDADIAYPGGRMTFGLSITHPDISIPCLGFDCWNDVDEIVFFNVALCDNAIRNHFLGFDQDAHTGTYLFPAAVTPCPACAACEYDPPPPTMDPLDYPEHYYFFDAGVTRPDCPDCELDCGLPTDPSCITCKRIHPTDLQGTCIDGLAVGTDDNDYCMPWDPPPYSEFEPMFIETPAIINQLSDFPLPRMVPGVPIHRNLPFLQLGDLGKDNFIGTDPTERSAAEIMLMLSVKFNYAYQVTHGFAYRTNFTVAGFEMVEALRDRWSSYTLGPRPPLSALINWFAADHLPDNGPYDPVLDRRSYLARRDLHSLTAIMPSGPEANNYFYRPCTSPPVAGAGPWLDLRGKRCSSPIFPSAEIISTPDREASSVSLASRIYDFHQLDGAMNSDFLTNIETQYATAIGSPGLRIDFVIENGEVLHEIPNIEESAISCLTALTTCTLCGFGCERVDPILSSDFAAYLAGIGGAATPANFLHYQADRFDLIRQAYKRGVQNTLGSLAVDAVRPNRRLTWYNVGGGQRSGWLYPESRFINDRTGAFLRHYPTPYFYPSGAFTWLRTSGATNGFETIESMLTEHVSLPGPVMENDNYFAPFVSPGYSDGATVNIDDLDIMRPGPYLGVLKGLSILGAEYFNVFQYNESKCPTYNHNRWHGWQLITPALVQGITSRYWDFYNNSKLLNGNLPHRAGWVGDFRFETECVNSFVYVRKGSTPAFGNTFLIGGFCGGNETDFRPTASDFIEDRMEETITLEGNEIQFEVRKQGSIYMLNMDDPMAPVFYQVDSWHEGSHYSHWTHDFVFEAEVFDANVMPGAPGTNPYSIETERNGLPPHTRIHDGNFLDFTSYLTLETNHPGGCWVDETHMPYVEYAFEPRPGSFTGVLTAGSTTVTVAAPPTTRQFEIWVLARAHNGSAGFFPYWRTGGVTVATFDEVCVSTTDFQWYRVEMPAVGYTAAVDVVHNVRISAWSSNLELDKVVIHDLSEGAFDTAPLGAGPVACEFPFEFPASACAGSIVRFEGAGYIECLDIDWDFGDGSVGTFTGSPVDHIYPAGAPYFPSITIHRPGRPDFVITSPTPVDATGVHANITTATGLAAVCSGDNLTLTAVPTTPPGFYTYLWDGLGVTGMVTPSVNILGDGSTMIRNYTVTVTLASDPLCFDEFDIDITHVENPVPVAVAVPSPYCAGAPLVLSTAPVVPAWALEEWREPALTLAWTPAPFMPMPVTGSHTYEVRVTDVNGCMGTDEVIVDPPFEVEITATPPGPVCPGTTIHLEAEASAPCPGCVTTWSRPGFADVIAPSLDVVMPGPVTVTISDGVCAATTVYTPLFFPDPGLVLAPTATVICDGDPIEIFAFGAGITAYRWFDGMTLIGGANPLVYAPPASGVYHIELEADFGVGCTTDRIGVDITVFDPAEITVTPGTLDLCPGEIGEFAAIPDLLTGDLPSGYRWGSTPGGTPFSFSGSGSGVTDDVIVYPLYGIGGTCTGPAGPTVHVINRPPPSVSIYSLSGALAICPGSTIELHTTDYPPAVPWASYVWNSSTAPAAVLSTADHITVGPGTYGVTVTSPSFYGSCEASDEIIIGEFTEPSFSFLPFPPQIDLCPGDEEYIIVIPDPIPGVTGYIFDPLSGGVAVASPFLVTGSAVTIPTTTAVNVYAVYASGACTTAVLQTYEVNEFPAPVVDIAIIPPGLPHTCGLFSPIGLSATVVPAGAYTYEWSPGTVLGSSSITTALTPGAYSVTATSMDYPNCSSTDEIVLTASSSPAVTISGPGFICTGQSTVLTAVATGGTAPYTYSWTGGGTGSTLEVTSAGTWVVTVTDAMGCTATDDLVIISATNCCASSCVTVPYTPNLSLAGDFRSFLCSNLITGTNTELPTLCTLGSLNITGASSGRITVADNATIGTYVPGTATQDHTLLSGSEDNFIAGYLNHTGEFDAYYHPVTVTSGTRYVFRAWVNNPLYTSSPSAKKPKFTLQVTQGGVTTTLASTGLISGTLPNDWYQVCGSYVAPSSGSAIFTITVETKNSHFAIDDIVIKEATSTPCKAEDFSSPGGMTIGDNHLRVFPNPSDAIFFLSGTLDAESNLNLTLTADNGVVLSSTDYLRSEGKFEIPIDLTNVTKGVYHLRVTIGGEQWYFKLVKQ